MANFRPLQPAPTDSDGPPQPQSRPLLVQKPKRTVTLGACVACRKRKSKCDGNRPVCTCCAQKETDCLYELGPNEKPSQAMKRKNEEMQGELSNLRQLYDFLRLRPEQEALEIFKRIRANPPESSPSKRIQELADFVRHGDLHDHQPSYHPTNTYPQTSSESMTLPPLRLALDSPNNSDSRKLSFHSAMAMTPDGPSAHRSKYISDVNGPARSGSQSPLPPLTSIEAILHRPTPVVKYELAEDPRLASIQHWTTVTQDVPLLVAIFTAWDLCEYSYYHYLDREAFLDDMGGGHTDFCSKLLVNALLASASFHSDLVEDRQTPFSKHSVTTAFYDEARRLWDLEAGQNSLTRVQAGICLFLVLGKHGRDRDGQKYLAEACRIACDHGLFPFQHSKIVHKPPHVPEAKWAKVRAVTAWSLFNFQLSMALTYYSVVLIDTLPQIAIPYGENPVAEELFRTECARHIIALDCIMTGRDPKDPERRKLPDPQWIESCYRRLTTWWELRSPRLHPDKVTTQENLLCAMMYNVNIIDLFHPLLEANSPLERIDPYRDRARSATSASLKELRRLLSFQEEHHGWESAITLILHPINVTSLSSLDELSSGASSSTPIEKTEEYQGVLTCLRALSSLSNYSYYAQPLFRLLTQKCQKLGVPLPPEVHGMLDRFTSVEWTQNAVKRVRSQYIADTSKTSTDAGSKRMDTIISQWDSLGLNGTGRGKGK